MAIFANHRTVQQRSTSHFDRSAEEEVHDAEHDSESDTYMAAQFGFAEPRVHDVDVHAGLRLGLDGG